MRDSDGCPTDFSEVFVDLFFQLRELGFGQPFGTLLRNVFQRRMFKDMQFRA